MMESNRSECEKFEEFAVKASDEAANNRAINSWLHTRREKWIEGWIARKMNCRN